MLELFYSEYDEFIKRLSHGIPHQNLINGFCYPFVRNRLLLLYQGKIVKRLRIDYLYSTIFWLYIKTTTEYSRVFY
jgi:hypothetical protein